MFGHRNCRRTDLKLRLYIACCCSILVWGAEAWVLDEEARRCINGANAYMLSNITNKTKREEATESTTTFNILAGIRARRLRWVGHILRLKDRLGETRLISQANSQSNLRQHQTRWRYIDRRKNNRLRRTDCWKQCQTKVLKDAVQRSTKPKRKKESQSYVRET